MDQIRGLILLFLSALIAYLISATSASTYLPQLVAFLAILFIIFAKNQLTRLYLVSVIVCLIVFSTEGLSSPFFFLIYFLLFTSTLVLHPAVSLAYSLILMLFLAHSLNSGHTLYTLISLALISPFVWFISREIESGTQTKSVIAKDETDILLWLNLKFKTGITTIIDLSSQLQSTSLTYSQQQHLKKIRSSAHSLLNSSKKLTQEISSDSSDETDN